MRAAKPLLELAFESILHRLAYRSNANREAFCEDNYWPETSLTSILSHASSETSGMTRYFIDFHNLVMRAGKPLMRVTIDPRYHRRSYFSNTNSEASFEDHYCTETSSTPIR